MQLNVDRIRSTASSALHRLFGGRIARTTFAIRVAILAATFAIVATPPSTFLAPSSKTLKDAYLVLLMAMLAMFLPRSAQRYVGAKIDLSF